MEDGCVWKGEYLLQPGFKLQSFMLYGHCNLRPNSPKSCPTDIVINKKKIKINTKNTQEFQFITNKCTII
jgi:hypothetical protein